MGWVGVHPQQWVPGHGRRENRFNVNREQAGGDQDPRRAGKPSRFGGTRIRSTEWRSATMAGKFSRRVSIRRLKLGTGKVAETSKRAPEAPNHFGTWLTARTDQCSLPRLETGSTPTL